MTACPPRYGFGPVRLARPASAHCAALRAPLRRATRCERKLRARIERAVASGDDQKAKGLQRLFLKSHSAKLCAVASVNPRLKSAERARSCEIVPIAERISAFRATDEEVVVVAADKPDGRWRPITMFGLERAALQTLASWAMRPFHPSDPRQFAITGGGHNEAARHIKQGLVDGYKWFVGLDITKFYSSIKGRSLYQMITLPMKAIEYIILPPPSECVRIIHPRRALNGLRLVEASQSGISQGSRSSPLIAEIIVKEILTQFSLDVRIINVADDFGVLARSKRDADAIQMALTRALARSPVGRFHLRSKVHRGPRRACDGFEFVGYSFQKRQAVIRCDISPANVEKFNSRVITYADEIARGRLHAITKLRRYVKSWWGSFPLISPDLQDANYTFARYHTYRVALHNRRSVAPLIATAMAWRNGDYAPLPRAIQLADSVRAIRRANPILRSNVRHWT